MPTKKLPFIGEFEDYHDIDHELYFAVREYINPKAKAKEIDPAKYGWEWDEDYNGMMQYYGLFYVGQLPDKKVIVKLLDKKIPLTWNKRGSAKK